MSKRLAVRANAWAAACAGILLAAALVAAQTATPVKATVNTAGPNTPRTSTANAKGWTLAHLQDGQPDFEGVWSNATLTPLERPRELGDKQFFTPAEAAVYEKKLVQLNNADRRDGDPVDDVARAYNDFWYDRGNKIVPTLRTSLIIDPPDGRIPPLTPEGQKRLAAIAEAKRARGAADSYLDRNLGERCITRGAPKLPSAYNNNFQIVQSRGIVAIYQEMIHEVRMIRTDGSAHVGPAIRQWLGDSRGHWEGDTLVVDTTNYNDQLNFATNPCCGGAGANLHLIERFKRIDKDTIDYQYTVDDPSTFTRQWTVAAPLTRAPGPIYEYDCHENNYGLSNLLQGARAEEKASAKK